MVRRLINLEKYLEPQIYPTAKIIGIYKASGIGNLNGIFVDDEVFFYGKGDHLSASNPMNRWWL